MIGWIFHIFFLKFVFEGGHKVCWPMGQKRLHLIGFFLHTFFQCMVILLVEMKKVMEKKKAETLNQ
jgi:hypothetical protein